MVARGRGNVDISYRHSAQKVEARIACKVINRMTRLGMLISRKSSDTNGG
jgi:hypothetical protein